ncbi:fibronectin type III domain-containing protein [Campylobacter mucosalis]|uniref:fibronectin type III domain-containing protein n=1 Tax=Campylobacter mucosalis TaxID=202 RepID=UPI00055765D4|nr:hypothetical protein [Campylobacter mucosalis]
MPQQRSYPRGVSNVTASKNAPKKIVLTWDSVMFDDFSHYKIYRTSSKILPYRNIAKTDKNVFEDLVNKNGEQMYYKITVVDKDGLESLKPNEPTIGSTLSSPEAPVLSQARFDGSSVYLSWNATNRAVSYTILRSGGESKKTINGINDTSYIDSSIKIGEKYSYKVVGVDEYGISSEHSNEVDVSTK